MTRQVYAIQRAEAGNVYTDTSSAKSITSGLIEWAVEQVGAEHILFGTDTPLYSVSAQRARIEGAEMDERAKRLVLYDNAGALAGIGRRRLVAIPGLTFSSSTGMLWRDPPTNPYRGAVT